MLWSQSELSTSLLEGGQVGTASKGKQSFARSAALLIGFILVFTSAVSLAVVFLLPDLAVLGLLAYCFGCRHGVDADHIAAIDNVTRRLVASGRRAMTVGIFFSLGHCTVVLLLCAFVMASADATSEQLQQFARVGGGIGPWVGAAVLFTIGSVNLYFARDLLAQYRQRTAKGHEHEIASLVGKCCPALVNSIDAPHKVFWIGLLFGLGLDTATEVGLLTLSALSQPAVPRLAVLVLPLLFAAGMALVDSLNGLLLLWAYEWAADNGPMHRLFFSLFLTVASAALALAIATVEALGALAEQLPAVRADCSGDDGDGGGDAGGAGGGAGGDAASAATAAAPSIAASAACSFWEGVLWLNEHMELVGAATVVAFLVAISCAVLFAHRCVPSQSQVDAEDEAKRSASLASYVKKGEYIVRFE